MLDNQNKYEKTKDQIHNLVYSYGSKYFITKKNVVAHIKKIINININKNLFFMFFYNKLIYGILLIFSIFKRDFIKK